MPAGRDPRRRASVLILGVSGLVSGERMFLLAAPVGGAELLAALLLTWSYARPRPRVKPLGA